jgi:hypothetical protein
MVASAYATKRTRGIEVALYRRRASGAFAERK